MGLRHSKTAGEGRACAAAPPAALEARRATNRPVHRRAAAIPPTTAVYTPPFASPAPAPPGTTPPTRPPSPTPLPNVLTNGGFETGALTGWEDGGGITIVGSAGYAGAWGARMATDGRI